MHSIASLQGCYYYVILKINDLDVQKRILLAFETAISAQSPQLQLLGCFGNGSKSSSNFEVFVLVFLSEISRLT